MSFTYSEPKTIIRTPSASDIIGKSLIVVGAKAIEKEIVNGRKVCVGDGWADLSVYNSWNDAFDCGMPTETLKSIYCMSASEARMHTLYRALGELNRYLCPDEFPEICFKEWELTVGSATEEFLDELEYAVCDDPKTFGYPIYKVIPILKAFQRVSLELITREQAKMHYKGIGEPRKPWRSLVVECEPGEN